MRVLAKEAGRQRNTRSTIEEVEFTCGSTNATRNELTLPAGHGSPARHADSRVQEASAFGRFRTHA